jgi:hypothetical protein
MPDLPRQLSTDDLEAVWVALAEAVTRTGSRDRVFLAKLALLCADAIGERATVERLIATAERDL